MSTKLSGFHPSHCVPFSNLIQTGLKLLRANFHQPCKVSDSQTSLMFLTTGMQFFQPFLIFLAFLLVLNVRNITRGDFNDTSIFVPTLINNLGEKQHCFTYTPPEFSRVGLDQGLVSSILILVFLCYSNFFYLFILLRPRYGLTPRMSEHGFCFFTTLTTQYWMIQRALAQCTLVCQLLILIMETPRALHHSQLPFHWKLSR